MMLHPAAAFLSALLSLQTPAAPVTAPPSEADSSEAAPQQDAQPTGSGTASEEAADEAADEIHGSEELSADVPTPFTSLTDAEALCRDMTPVEKITFTVELPPDPPPAKPPKTKAARKRLEERRKRERLKAEKKELARLKAEFVSRQNERRREVFETALSWENFSDLLTVTEEELPREKENQADRKADDAAALPQAADGTATSPAEETRCAENVLPDDSVQCVPPQPAPPPKPCPPAAPPEPKITSLRLELRRAFVLSDGRVKLFDLSTGGFSLVPTEAGLTGGRLRRALKSGEVQLTLRWRPAAAEAVPCTLSHLGNAAVSADFEEVLLTADGAVLAQISDEHAEPPPQQPENQESDAGAAAP